MSAAELPDVWADWSARRPTPRVTHLDSGAAGRSSQAVLDATAAHARREAELGAYVAAAQIDDQLETTRAALAGLLAVPAAGLAFLESATAALAALLTAWPIAEDDSIGVVAAEWGPNLELFAGHGLRIIDLATDDSGALDLDALCRTLTSDPPTIVHLTQVTSHRGLVQPVAAAAHLCQAAGIALWVDAAQALGHVDAATGADAVYATSRKWLTGPRGVGMLGVAERRWDDLRVPRPATWPGDLAPAAYLESHEAHVSGRVGLGVAVREYLDTGPGPIARRLDEVGAMTRAALADVPGWTVVGADKPAHEGAGAITALRPTAGQDVAATRARLFADHGIVTTACAPARAPRELSTPVLRVSPHVDCTPTALRRLCDGLRNR